MSDPIDRATNAARARATSIISTVPRIPAQKLPPVPQIKLPSVSVPPLTIPPAQIQNLKAQLPVIKDPRLIAREKEAEILEKKTMTERKLLNAEETALEKAKQLLKSFAIPTINFPPKLPAVNVKVIQTLLLAQKVKVLTALKQKLSRENLRKASKSYEFPLSPTSVSGTPDRKLPAIPPLPTFRAITNTQTRNP
jgi:hypothetical protein